MVVSLKLIFDLTMQEFLALFYLFFVCSRRNHR